MIGMEADQTSSRLEHMIEEMPSEVYLLACILQGQISEVTHLCRISNYATDVDIEGVNSVGRGLCTITVNSCIPKYRYDRKKTPISVTARCFFKQRDDQPHVRR